VRNARALQEALGVGVDAYSQKLERDNEKGSKEALQDAATGVRKVDQNKGYEETYQRVEAANDLAEMNRELSKKLTEAGWEDLPQDQAQAMIDGYFKEQLAGINAESVYGTLMADGILKVNADLLDVHNQSQLAKDQQERRTMLLNAARSQYETDGGLDYEQLMKDSATLLPGRGGRMTFMELLDTLATELGDPSVLLNAPEKFPNGEPTGVNDPKFRNEWLNPAIARAEQVKLRNERKAEAKFLEDQRAARAAVKSGLDIRASEGDLSIIPEVMNGMKEPEEEGVPPLLTEAEGRALLNRVRTGQKKAGLDEAYHQLYRTGNAFGLTEAEYDGAARQYAQAETERLQSEGLEGEELQAAVMESTVERAIANDRLPKFLKDQLMASTANPDRLAQSADLRRLVEENSPGLVERSISDLHSGRLETYEYYMTETGGDVERTIALMEQADPSLSKGRTKDINAIAVEVVEELADDAQWWGSAPVAAADVRRAEQLAKLYIEQGIPDEAVPEMVAQAMQARNVRVGGVLYPADFGWTGDGEEALDWFLSGGTGDYWPEDAELVAQPHPTQRGVILVRDTNSGLLYRAPYEVKQVEAQYRAHLDDQLIADVNSSRNTESAAYAEAKRRAAERMFPDLSSMEDPGSYAEMMGSPAMQFSRLSPEEQERAIRAELSRNNQ
jgi:hypothetical protein